MNILKNILVALAVIIVIAAVGIYFLPNHYSVSNSIEINKPADVVYAQLADYNKWGTWDPWMEVEPDAKITVEGTSGMPGYKMSWEGKKVGSGNMTLTSAVPNQSLNSELQFIKPFKAEAKDMWKLETMGDKTKVTWTSSGGLKYPVGRLFGLSVDKMVSVPEKHGLDNLKKVCEAIPAPVASTDTTMANKAM